jgi:hypothetical protein
LYTHKDTKFIAKQLNPKTFITSQLKKNPKGVFLRRNENKTRHRNKRVRKERWLENNKKHKEYAEYIYILYRKQKNV